ncbi:magnesium chelatase accessory protein [Rhodobacter aestuarii]|uniref:Magnesium chelatase accessory protein n=1 Tax=Rhodobacter aestuarii TaxID=453582 RepID=A0A1N7MKE4_9RHOB|nr:alpha/beta fold hydrolase BchO [Rhodobacter aestuarii]PTV96694.1 magnesium chelatase accessory protein [Rhodobacter aestuarii]SIS86635.1 magnesium chelatase accessory protein [Rhodobacter aestuarii]
MDPRNLPANWPYRSAAQMVRVERIDWWVVDTGPRDAPALLLLHGLGASGHSFRRTIPGLAKHYRLIVPDLPGHGCTRTKDRDRLGLSPIAEDLCWLCDAMGVQPGAVIGHSAGGAIALQMALNTSIPRVVGINAALDHFEGVTGVLFPLIARGLAAFPLTAPVAARLWASPARVSQLLDSTGSVIDAAGKAQYTTLVQDTEHVAGALDMMAQWRLDPLILNLPRLRKPALLLAGKGDKAVPPAVSESAAHAMPQVELRMMEGGHLLHEVAPDGLSALLADWLAGHGLGTPPATRA